jgi:SAM-dependent methyltransferase
MHPEAIHFLRYARQSFPDSFHSVRVLDVGSGDLNGNNRDLFEDAQYHGNDVIAAANVTIVSRTKDLPFADGFFDTIVSSECFEHDPEYTASLNNIVRMLKPGGLFVFTCASTGRAEHGTRRADPASSLGTIGEVEDMQDYYKNLEIRDIAEALGGDLSVVFAQYESYYHPHAKDLYFWGVKHGSDHIHPEPPEYTLS